MDPGDPGRMRSVEVKIRRENGSPRRRNEVPLRKAAFQDPAEAQSACLWAFFAPDGPERSIPVCLDPRRNRLIRGGGQDNRKDEEQGSEPQEFHDPVNISQAKKKCQKAAFHGIFRRRSFQMYSRGTPRNVSLHGLSHPEHDLRSPISPSPAILRSPIMRSLFQIPASVESLTLPSD